MSSDPLAAFYTTAISVRRKLGDGANGPVFAAADTSLRGLVSTAARLVRTADGAQVVSMARVQLPVGTAAIPLESEVTLADGRVGFVLVEDRHDTGPPFLPRHYTIDLRA